MASIGPGSWALFLNLHEFLVHVLHGRQFGLIEAGHRVVCNETAGGDAAVAAITAGRLDHHTVLENGKVRDLRDDYIFQVDRREHEGAHFDFAAAASLLYR